MWDLFDDSLVKFQDWQDRRRVKHRKSYPHKPFKKARESQASSPLFTKLPFELRNLIWEYAVGGREIKIMREYGSARLSRPGLTWLSLLKTCQQAYEEGVDVLYTTTRFQIKQKDLGSGPVLPMFRKSIVPEYWQRIRHVTLYYSFLDIEDKLLYTTPRANDVDEGNWSLTVDCLSTLPELQHLTFVIRDSTVSNPHRAGLSKLLKLENVAPSQSFEVWLGSPLNKADRAWLRNELPCTLRSKVEDLDEIRNQGTR